MVRSFLNADSISGEGLGGGGRPINAKTQGRICSICFKEIKFLINFTGEAEARDWMTPSSAPCCAPLLTSLELISSIHNEPAERTDKCFLMSDYSHCCVTGSFTSCLLRAITNTPTLANPEDQPAMPTNGRQKKQNEANSSNTHPPPVFFNDV